MSYVYNPGYLEVEQGLISSTDKTKVASLNFRQGNNTNITLGLPVSSTNLVGDSTTDTLTNKTINHTSNNVTANGLRTQSGGVVNVSGSNATAPGQILVTSNSTTANWTNPLPTYVFSNGTLVQPSIATFKQWHNIRTTSNETATFNVTASGLSGGAAVFTNLNECVIQATARYNSTTITDIPFASVRSISGTQVIVNVLSPVGILVGGVSMKNNNQNVTVYLSVFGL